MEKYIIFLILFTLFFSIISSANVGNFFKKYTNQTQSILLWSVPIILFLSVPTIFNLNRDKNIAIGFIYVFILTLLLLQSYVINPDILLPIFVIVVILIFALCYFSFGVFSTLSYTIFVIFYIIMTISIYIGYDYELKRK